MDSTIELIINGVSQGATGMTGTWSGGSSGTIQFGGADCYLDSVTITSNPNTPQLFTANGKPLILPDFKSEVA